VLGGWLLNTVRFVVRDLQRKRHRRQFHERGAARMIEQERGAGGGDIVTEPVWEQLAPALDDALSDLGTKSRDALVLKYFEDNSGPEVAERLGISENAARKRISRAVDELRAVFAKKGIAVSSTAVGQLMT